GRPRIRREHSGGPKRGCPRLSPRQYVRVRGFAPGAGERSDRQLRQRTLYQAREPPQPGILPDRGPDEIRLVAKRRERCFERLRLSALADAIEARVCDDCSAAW